MRSHRTISRSLVAAGAFVALLAPASAQAGSLLSGYGGPGEGNQAVLGSALVGKSKGGSGGSGSAGSPSGGGAEASQSASSPAGSGPGSREAGGAHGAEPGTGEGSSSRSEVGSGSNRAARKGASASGPSGSQAQQFASVYPATERVPSGDQGVVLGLTGQDILLVVLAAVLLIAIGWFTRRLERSAGQADLGS